jgi:hypothetical protein
MSGGLKLLCFLLLLPAIAAIGHDLYAAYYSDPQKIAKLERLDIDPQTYQASDAGYLLLQYAPNFYEQSRTMIGEAAWVRYADPILKQYTFVVALIPAALFYLYLLIAFVLGLPPFSGNKFIKKSATDQNAYERRNAETTFKYKRK